MKKIQKHIEIVCSTEVELSSMGKNSRDAALTVLVKHYTKVGITIVNNLSDLDALVARQPDLVFLGLKFVPANPALGFQDPNKIWLAQYLDDHGIAYTGSSHAAHELELDKPLAKQCVLDARLQTSPFYVATADRWQAKKGSAAMQYPLFVKPTDRGGGLGIDSNSVVRTPKALQAKVQSIATALQSDSLVEQYLPGREFSVAILKNELSAQFSIMPLELIAPADKHGVRILSEQIKSADTERFTEVTDPSIKARISTLAINVFHALGARDYGRIDIRLDEAGTPHFLEANLIPSVLKDYGNFPKACALNIGLGYDAMILSIVRLGLARATDRYEIDAEPLVLAPFGPITAAEIA